MQWQSMDVDIFLLYKLGQTLTKDKIYYASLYFGMEGVTTKQINHPLTWAPENSSIKLYVCEIAS